MSIVVLGSTPASSGSRSNVNCFAGREDQRIAVGDDAQRIDRRTTPAQRAGRLQRATRWRQSIAEIVGRPCPIMLARPGEGPDLFDARARSARTARGVSDSPPTISRRERRRILATTANCVQGETRRSAAQLVVPAGSSTSRASSAARLLGAQCRDVVRFPAIVGTDEELAAGICRAIRCSPAVGSQRKLQSAVRIERMPAGPAANKASRSGRWKPSPRRLASAVGKSASDASCRVPRESMAAVREAPHQRHVQLLRKESAVDAAHATMLAERKSAHAARAQQANCPVGRWLRSIGRVLRSSVERHHLCGVGTTPAKGGVGIARRVECTSRADRSRRPAADRPLRVRAAAPAARAAHPTGRTCRGRGPKQIADAPSRRLRSVHSRLRTIARARFATRPPRVPRRQIESCTHS